MPRKHTAPACVSPRFQKLLTLAQDEVRLTLDSLPQRLQAEAKALPVTYESKPGKALLDDGIDEDTLGLFVGNEFAYSDSANSGLPAQIILFLDNLWDEADHHEEFFREEVRITLLHELGHYLGLDERDLEERGLD
ncbi:MAG: metallopeptidase family protein [Verrucomicrobia bacterium]|nr:metallopeptidase family protein [Verrucomicrobiota bacterium]